MKIKKRAKKGIIEFNTRKFLLNTDQPLSTSRIIYNVIDYSLWAIGLSWMYTGNLWPATGDVAPENGDFIG